MSTEKNVFDSIENAEAFFHEVQRSLESKNRFFPVQQLHKAMCEVLKCSSAIKIVSAGEVFYRGRFYRADLDKATSKPAEFKGYDAKGSTVNLDDPWPKAGRMNAEGIHVLYVATGDKTCAKELGAAADEKISIADMTVQSTLRLVNFPYLETSLRDPKRKAFVRCINEVLSSGYGGQSYVLPQYISSWCQYKGYDGIIYRSKYANKRDIKKGMNIAIFEYNKCIPTASRIETVNTISLGFKKEED